MVPIEISQDKQRTRDKLYKTNDSPYNRNTLLASCFCLDFDNCDNFFRATAFTKRKNKQ